VEEFLDGDWLLALGAFVSAVSAALMGWAALVSSRHKGEKECEERLAVLRKENMALHDELYERKMHPPPS
jgi:hypothetical protein